MAAVKLRNSCSFPNLLLSCLNIFLLILSSASIAPIIILRIPPTPLAYAFLLTSFISILSSFICFYTQLTRRCFITHISLLLTSALAQLLTFIALFTRETSCLEMLKSRRDPREAKVLVRLECGVLMSMLLMQLLILVLSCLVHSCCVREYERMDAEKRNKRSTKVQQEEEVVISCKEFGDQKMDSKCLKTDLEG